MSETPNPWAEKIAEFENDTPGLDKEVANQVSAIDDPFLPYPMRPSIEEMVKFAEAVELHADTLKGVEKPKDLFGQEVPERGIDKYGDMKWRHIAASIDHAGLTHRKDLTGMPTKTGKYEVEQQMKKSMEGDKNSVASFGYWVLNKYFDNPEDIPVEAFRAFLHFGSNLRLKKAADGKAGKSTFGLPHPFRNQPLDTAVEFQPEDGQNSPLQKLVTEYKNPPKPPPYRSIFNR